MPMMMTISNYQVLSDAKYELAWIHRAGVVSKDPIGIFNLHSKYIKLDLV
jgi:hypothetical protein